MSSHSSRRHTVHRVNNIAQVHCAVCGVEMICQLTVYARHIHIVNAIFLQHLACNITTCQWLVQRFLRVFLKFTLQGVLNYITCNCYSYKNYVYNTHFFILIIQFL